SMNPKANIQETLEARAVRKGYSDPFEYWQSEDNPFVAWPSRLLSLVTTADGASAIVLTRESLSRGLKSDPILLKGFGISYGDLPWYGADPTHLEIDKRASEHAMQMAAHRLLRTLRKLGAAGYGSVRERHLAVRDAQYRAGLPPALRVDCSLCLRTPAAGGGAVPPCHCAGRGPDTGSPAQGL